MKKSWTPVRSPEKIPVPESAKRYHGRLADIAELLYHYFCQPSDFELSDAATLSLNRSVLAPTRRSQMRQRG